ncbi:MAG: DUF2782 domain-containing protein [Gammaproteobacteria bacterium]
MKPFLAAVCLGLALAVTVSADEPPPSQFVEVPPPPPPVSVDDDEDFAGEEGETEPEVTIIQRRDAVYEEYRLNGRLYMVKVKPVVGPPYYFVDRDGDGLMETRMNDRATQIDIPKWVIFSW